MDQTETNTLSPLQVKVLQQVENMLRGLKADYHIKLGNLFEVNTFPKLEDGKHRKRRELVAPMGTYSNYVKPYLENLHPGGVAVIPAGPFGIDRTCHAVDSMANKLFGKGTYLCSRNKENTAYEIARF